MSREGGWEELGGGTNLDLEYVGTEEDILSSSGIVGSGFEAEMRIYTMISQYVVKFRAMFFFYFTPSQKNIMHLNLRAHISMFRYDCIIPITSKQFQKHPGTLVNVQ